MLDMDTVTALGVLGAAEVARLPRFARWRRGERLKLLLVGYNGARNTGADVRVAAMVEQFYRVLGRAAVDVGVLTLDAGNIRVYYGPETRLIEFSSIFFKDLLEACSEHHMAVLCEGSTLKSKFANALTLFFCQAAGVMRAQGKPCLAYGSEAGEMDPFVRRVAARLCRDTYFIARTEPSLAIIRGMGMQGHLGTDTAWTFPPAPRGWVEEELRRRTGWDGRKPLLGLAVINPFCWPVQPSLVRLGRAWLTGRWEHHYQKWYFFSHSAERQRAFEAYIRAIAAAADRFRAEHDVHLVIIGMERLDLDACTALHNALASPAEIFSSRDYDGYQLTGILHALSLLVTSRYHARVLSMTGAVPSVAVSMDERLRNLLAECGHLDDYYLSTDDPDLGRKLGDAMDKAWNRRDAIARELRAALPRYLRTMAEMGKFFREYVERSFPGIALDPAPTDWKGYLPDLHPALAALV